MELVKEMQAYLNAAETDSNLSHQRGYLPILERYKDIMTPEEAGRFQQVKNRIELAMDQTRGIVRRRMYG